MGRLYGVLYLDCGKYSLFYHLDSGDWGCGDLLEGLSPQASSGKRKEKGSGTELIFLKKVL